MKQRSGLYPRVRVGAAGSRLVSHAGGVVLTEVVRAVGLDRSLSEALSAWRRPLAVHDPAKVVLDLAVSLALGGDCLADIAVLRAEPAVFGPVASDPTVSRTIDALAGDAPTALLAINGARAAARARAWTLAGGHAPNAAADTASPLIVDVDATLITAHSDKEHAAPTFKRGFGFHPMWAFVDHGADGTGEPLAVLLRPGQRGQQHRGRPRPGDPGGVAAAARPPARRPARAEGPDPRRRRRVHPRVPGLADRPAAVLLGRVHPARRRRTT